jgi:translation initiation factor eIF-2B subunit epsilon
MDMEVFEKHSNVQIRNDFVDCQIDICSIEVRINSHCNLL